MGNQLAVDERVVQHKRQGNGGPTFGSIHRSSQVQGEQDHMHERVCGHAHASSSSAQTSTSRGGISNTDWYSYWSNWSSSPSSSQQSYPTTYSRRSAPSGLREHQQQQHRPNHHHRQQQQSDRPLRPSDSRQRRDSSQMGRRVGSDPGCSVSTMTDTATTARQYAYARASGGKGKPTPAQYLADYHQQLLTPEAKERWRSEKSRAIQRIGSLPDHVAASAYGSSSKHSGPSQKLKKGELPPTARALLQAAAERAVRHQMHIELRAERALTTRGMPTRPASAAVEDGSGGRADVADVWDRLHGAPTAPRTLAAAFEEAFTTQNEEWASEGAVAALFLSNTLYVTPDKQHIRGRDAVVSKLNEGMGVILGRINSAGVAAESLEKMMGKAKVELHGPDYSEKEGTWVMTYRFEMLMMKTIIRDEFWINRAGEITKLMRTRPKK